MNDLFARIRVFFKSAPTYLVAIATAVTIITEEISQELSADVAANFVSIGGKVVSIIGAAVAIIRRVTPVLPDERGMLSPPKPLNPEDPAFDEVMKDRGALDVQTIFFALGALVLAVFCILWLVGRN